jgi:hypothetical protein
VSPTKSSSSECVVGSDEGVSLLCNAFGAKAGFEGKVKREEKNLIREGYNLIDNLTLMTNFSLMSYESKTNSSLRSLNKSIKMSRKLEKISICK